MSSISKAAAPMGRIQEKLHLLKLSEAPGGLWPALTEKDILPFGEVECAESGQWLTATVGVPHRHFFKDRNRDVAEQRTRLHTVALPTEARFKTQFVPTEASYLGRVEGCTAKRLQ